MSATHTDRDTVLAMPDRQAALRRDFGRHDTVAAIATGLMPVVMMMFVFGNRRGWAEVCP
jgi:hypothetical protein